MKDYGDIREQTEERGTLMIPFDWKQIGLVSKNPTGSFF